MVHQQSTLSWTDFKALVITTKGLFVQEIPHETQYLLLASDHNVGYSCIIKRRDTRTDDQIDYEDNHQADSNRILEPRDDAGNPRIAPTFEDDQGLNGAWITNRYVITPGVLNIFDEVVVKELKVRGGWYELMHSPSDCPALDTDYIEFSIVDKDDVLGLFALYGLTVGVDVLELAKFVRTEYVNPFAAGQRQLFTVNGASDVLAGLYFRKYYMSTGTEQVIAKRTVWVHESD